MKSTWEEALHEYTPENVQAHKKALEETVRLTHEVFRPGGILETQFGKAHRKGQYAMAMDVARAFQDGHSLAAEAGTGTGKTLAYGVPAAILGLLHPGVPELKKDMGDREDPNEPKFIIRPLQTVISVHTLALQDQLEGDFRLISEITKAATGQTPRTLRVSGRENYFCEVTTRRLANEAEEPPIRALATKLYQEYEALKEAKQLRSGLASELPSWPTVGPEFRRLFTANDLNCAMHRGQEFCNYDRAKAQIPKAHIISINHNLLALGWPGTWHQKIVDEAHTLEPVIVESTELETNIDKLEKAMGRPNVGHRGPPGVPFNLGQPFCIKVMELARAIEAEVTKNKIQRVRGPLHEETTKNLEILLKEIPHHTADGIRGIAGARNIQHNDIRAYFVEGIAPNLQGIGKDAGKAMDALRNIKIFYNHVETLLVFAKGPLQPDTTLVHWTEEPNGNASRPTLKVTEADPRPTLQALHKGSPSIMTSATLAGPRGLVSFIESQGLTPESCRKGEYPAPFNLEEKMKIVIPAGLPEPGKEEQEWKKKLPDFVLEAINQTNKIPEGGGTLVLLTSRADMQTVAQKIAGPLRDKGTPVFIQDGSMERREMLEKMKGHGKAVILGLESFWTGVDIPGNALRHVVITRIPFQVPTPLNEARREIAEARGLNAFQEVDLRNALNTMRQGIGRLIRTTEDDGIITILDPRVLTKAYGKTLLHGLPEASRSYSEHIPAIPNKGFSQSWNKGYQKPNQTRKPSWNPTMPDSLQ